MVTVYVIQNLAKDYRYVGITNDLTRRLRQHNNGHSKATRPYAPFILIFSEEFADYEGARRKEIFLKSGVGRKLLDNL